MSELQTNVLLVDDDPSIRRLVVRWLEAAGYRVREAADALAGLAAIEQECPHILITDWEMPGLDGLELCRRMRAMELPHYVYTMFLTVRSASDDMVRGLEAGADDFLKKPIDREEMLARIRTRSRLVQVEQKLRDSANRDALTGLLNRGAFHERLTAECNRAKRHRISLSCVMGDIDYFKRINDTYGHYAGDLALREMARVLKESVRACDVVCRYGGEEFCILLPETNETQALLWAERLRERLSEVRLAIPSHESELTLSASFGVSQLMLDIERPEELVDLADQAMLVAKRAGRNRTVAFGDLISSRNTITDHDRLTKMFGTYTARQVMTSLVSGVRRDEFLGRAAEYFLQFQLHFAPVIDDRGALVGIVSDRDLMAATINPDWVTRSIGDIMRENVVCYEESTPAIVIYEFLCRVSLRGVVIVREGKPVGLVSRSGLLRWFSNAASVDREHGSERTELAEPRRLTAVADRLVAEAARLRQELDEATDDRSVCTVGGATRIQELVSEMLNQIRYVKPSDDDHADNDRDETRVGIAALLAQLNLEADESHPAPLEGGALS